MYKQAKSQTTQLSPYGSLDLGCPTWLALLIPKVHVGYYMPPITLIWTPIGPKMQLSNLN